MEKNSSSRAQSVPGNKKKVCPICKKVFSSVNLSRHLETHLPESERVKFKCSVDQCSKEYFNPARLKQHFAAEHSSTPRIKFKCDQCSKEYYAKSDMNVHVKQIHSGAGTRYGCSICDATFMTKNGRDYHIVTSHTAEKAFKCKQCPAKFSFSFNLKHHQLVHTENKPHKCKICSKQFKRPYELVSHTKNVHSQRAKSFQCSVCPNAYFYKSSLRAHSRIHSHEVGQYSCYFCPKVLLTRHSQENHLRIHTQEKPFSCLENSCQFSTPYSENLRRHRKRHQLETGQITIPRTWPCYFCLKTKTRFCHLEVHLRIHTLENPFHCALCRRPFRSNEVLQMHIFTHTKEKPFSCPHCQKCFASNGNLKKHITVMHN